MNILNSFAIPHYELGLPRLQTNHFFAATGGFRMFFKRSNDGLALPLGLLRSSHL